MESFNGRREEAQRFTTPGFGQSNRPRASFPPPGLAQHARPQDEVNEHTSVAVHLD
jgi:hypothetical protein